VSDHTPQTPLFIANPFYSLAKDLVGGRVDQGEFVGYSDDDLDGKVDDLAAEFEETWREAHEGMLRDEPTDEDRREWAAEDKRDLERGA
jgi:hypothetical protein